MFKHLKDKQFYKKKAIRITLIGAMGLLGVGLIWFGVTVMSGQSSFVEVVMNVMPSRSAPRTVLVLGTDATPGTKRTDTMIVFHIDPDSGKIGMLSIPRDSRVEIPDHGLDKINHAFAYGGADLSVQTVSRLLNIPIDNYIHVDLDAVGKIIDSIGGVDIEVPKNMHYTDRAGGLYINFKKGLQHMTGADAMGYLRFRHDLTGDIGRVERQQAFVKAVMTKVMTAGNIVRSPVLIAELLKCVDTNLSTGEVLSLAMKFSSASKNGQVISGMVHGVPESIGGVSYWIPDPGQINRMVATVLLGQGDVSGNVSTLPALALDSGDEMSDDGDVSDAPELDLDKIRTKVNVTPSMMVETQVEMMSQDMSDKFKSLPQPYSVEVLNGSGTVGLARELADMLRTMSIQVPWYANASGTDYEQTMLVDWKGNASLALSLAQLLNIDPARIIVYDKPDNLLDATILVGRDWIDLRKKTNSHGI